ncbi:MAG: HAMP domain-containing histidine kinase [bacterium]|nr:HAMP domain-containing histidine kinase [bacterium]
MFTLCDVVQRFATDLIFVIDRSGTIREANDRFWSELGLSKESAGPAALLGAFVEDERALALRTWNTVIAHRNVQRSVRRMKATKGETKVFSIVESPVTFGNDSTMLLGVARDITEESALEEKLWSAHENRVAALEYAVRASMGLVKGYVFSLQKLENLPRDKREQFSRVIAEEVDTMGRNIENLLLSRGNGEISSESSLFDIAAIVEEAEAFFKGECERRSISLTVQKPQTEVNFFGQPIAVMRVIANVLDFEIMRLTHSGEIQISLSDSDEYIEVRIADNGPAVTQEQLEWLSEQGRSGNEQFIALSAGKADLDVARLIAESLGGGIIAGPCDTGGIAFTIMLPRMPFTLGRTETSSAALTI